MADSIQCGIHSLMNIHKSVDVDLISVLRHSEFGFAAMFTAASSRLL